MNKIVPYNYNYYCMLSRVVFISGSNSNQERDKFQKDCQSRHVRHRIRKLAKLKTTNALQVISKFVTDSPATCLCLHTSKFPVPMKSVE